MSFGQAPRFEVQIDGTIVARAGTQMNCAGIARLHVRIVSTNSGVLTFGPADDAARAGDGYGYDVVGHAVPKEYRLAAFAGVKAAFEAFDVTTGVHVELLAATVHEVDARERRFWEAGYRAMAGWLEACGVARSAVEDDEQRRDAPPN